LALGGMWSVAHNWSMPTTTPQSAVITDKVPPADGTEATRASRRGLPGDLARRVTHRRSELGLSTQELARRAGVDAWFLAYFERSSDTTLTGGTLLRVAAALDTTPSALEGGLVDRAPGTGHASSHPMLEQLTAEECEAHLAPGGVGRIILSTDSGPTAFPVNFIYTDGTIVFRTSDGMAATISGVVAFEVDHVDEAMSAGWSVLVRGHARLIEEPQERLAIAQLDLDPWAGGARLNIIRVTPFELTGRVIVQRDSPQHR
jgi:transcriptional regulator with XRE-family HTH domain